MTSQGLFSSGILQGLGPLDFYTVPGSAEELERPNTRRWGKALSTSIKVHLEKGLDKELGGLCLSLPLPLLNLSKPQFPKF